MSQIILIDALDSVEDEGGRVGSVVACEREKKKLEGQGRREKGRRESTHAYLQATT